jgi:DNA-binding transcriptional MerR regulator
MSESEDSPHGASYTIEMVARITRIPADEIVVYYRSGFVTPIEARDENSLVFDERAVLQLRRIAFLLSEYQINREGLKMVAGLMDEVERLREEVRFLRER